MSKLSFISDEDLENHITETIKFYGNKLEPINLKKFNSNIIDPIKLVFDKTVYKLSWEEIIKNEIARQRDKSNTNEIGYFNQNIFRYIKDCEVPKSGWDVVFAPESGLNLQNGEKVNKIHVEIKNKHNTMNSSSSASTYIRMQNAILKDKDCACFLVEVIAKKSQNIVWGAMVDKTKVANERIRRVSMDKFYEIVTGDGTAFYKLCAILPEIISGVVANNKAKTPNDTVLAELEKLAISQGFTQDKDFAMLMAMYMLGFGSYKGF